MKIQIIDNNTCTTLCEITIIRDKFFSVKEGGQDVDYRDGLWYDEESFAFWLYTNVIRPNQSPAGFSFNFAL